MTSIVAMMKYINIEFANQAVMIPLYADVPPKEDTISDLINTNDIAREQKASKLFDGSLIPPATVWQSISDRNKYQHTSTTKILKRIKVEAGGYSVSNIPQEMILYAQDGGFSNF